MWHRIKVAFGLEPAYDIYSREFVETLKERLRIQDEIVEDYRAAASQKQELIEFLIADRDRQDDAQENTSSAELKPVSGPRPWRSRRAELERKDREQADRERQELPHVKV